jgi:hypothetical protein
MMDVTNGDSQRISVDDFIDCDTTPSVPNLGDDLWTGDNDNTSRNILHTEQPDLINEEAGVDDGDDNAGKWDNGIPRVIFVRSDEAEGQVCRDQASGGLDSTKRAHGTLLFSLLQTEDPIIDDDHPE